MSFPPNRTRGPLSPNELLCTTRESEQCDWCGDWADELFEEGDDLVCVDCLVESEADR